MILSKLKLPEKFTSIAVSSTSPCKIQNVNTKAMDMIEFDKLDIIGNLLLSEI